jgi:hypothetical protein
MVLLTAALIGAMLMFLSAPLWILGAVWLCFALIALK